MKIKKLAAAFAAAAMLLTATACEANKADITEGITITEGESSVGNIGELSLAKGDLVAVFEFKGYGTITAKLFPEIAPIGVDNFKKLADSGYFDGKNMHRVMPNFMMQGGSLNGDGTGGDAMVSGGVFGIEPDVTKACHFYGALCYANANGLNSTQFYIVNNKEPQDVKGLSEYYLTTAKEAQGLADAASSDEEKAYYEYYADYFRKSADVIGSLSEEAAAKYLKVGGTPSLDGDYTVFGQVYNGFDVIDKIAAVELEKNAAGEESSPKKEIIIKSVKVIEYDGN